MTRLAAFAIVVAAMASAGAQTPSRDLPRVASSGSGVIVGIVISDDEARAPVRRATLALSRAGVSDTRVIASDDRGQYVFDDLPAGVYTLTATKGGYLSVSYGAARSGLPGMPIPIGDGQRFTANPLAITHGSVITGHITDDRGLPVADAAVYAAAFDVVGGVRRRRNASQPPLRVTTDAHGTYRFFGLPAGDYIVGGVGSFLTATELTPSELLWAQHQVRSTDQTASASAVSMSVGGGDLAPPVSRMFGETLTYFSGSVDLAAANVVSVGKGEERGGVDFRLQILPLARVSGIVIGPDGQRVANPAVIRTSKAGAFFTQSGGVVERGTSDGSFVLREGVPPGEHVVSVRAAVGPATPQTPQAVLWGRAEITIHGDDVSNLTIQVQPGVTVSGAVTFEGTTAPPSSVAGLQLRLTSAAETPVAFGSFVSGVQPDRSFKIESLEPARYQLKVIVPPLFGSPTQWTVKSAIVGGKDVLDDAIEVHVGENISGVVVTLSDRHTDLSGTLVDATGQPTPQFYLLAFSTNQARWIQDSRWIKLVRADAKGGYRITGLPAGEYYVAALTELDPSQQYDPAFLEQLVPASLKIALADGEPKTQTLRVGG